MAALERGGQPFRAAFIRRWLTGVFELTTYEMEVDDTTYRICIEAAGPKSKKSRFYTWNAPAPAMAAPPAGRKGANEDNDAAWRRYNRAEVRLMREQVLLGLKAMDITMDGDTPAKQLPFDKHAGCAMCPCSPGFVAEALWVRTAAECGWPPTTKDHRDRNKPCRSCHTRVDVYVTRLVPCTVCGKLQGGFNCEHCAVRTLREEEDALLILAGQDIPKGGITAEAMGLTDDIMKRLDRHGWAQAWTNNQEIPTYYLTTRGRDRAHEINQGAPAPTTH
jgi:hypothetical protein